MGRRRFQQFGSRGALLGFVAAILTACGPSIGPKAVTRGQSQNGSARNGPGRPAATSQPTLPVADPVLTLIADSDRHFKIGQKELELGHVEAAKQEFNRALDVLLE